MVDLPIKEHLAEWLKVAKVMYLDTQELSSMRNAEFNIVEDIIKDQLILGLSTYVLAEKLEPIIKTERVPCTWWDMFKETYQHKWWMFIRKPVKYREFTLQVEPRLLFPDTKHYPKQFGRVFRFVETTKAWWEDVDS